jgi:hypothetical protein
MKDNKIQRLSLKTRLKSCCFDSAHSLPKNGFKLSKLHFNFNTNSKELCLVFIINREETH